MPQRKRRPGAPEVQPVTAAVFLKAVGVMPFVFLNRRMK